MNPIVLKGKYAEAHIYADIVEQSAISQVINLLNQPYMEGEKIRMMPDIHAGTGCTIGTTMTINNKKICPNLIGVDIGCSMYVLILEETEIDCAKLDEVIREYIPSGLNSRETVHPMAKDFPIKSLLCHNSINLDHMMCSLGSLGGGNHFIEVNRDSKGRLYLVIHTGSRQLGIQVAKHYQRQAIKSLRQKAYNKASQKVISELMAAGKKSEIQKALNNLVVHYMPDDLAYCEGKLADDYLHDMKITQDYAVLNRKIIATEIVNHMGWHVVDSFTTMHNYIDIDNMILRKGAVSARKGERLLIPMNMRDGSLLCVGKGNDEWNQSAPHGAGRLMSRADAKEKFSLEEYQESMRGIFTTSISFATLDECPMTYKPMEAIIDAIEDTVEIVDIIKPIYNFKA